MNIGVDGYHRNADSPVSDNGPDYAGESTELETEDENSPKKEGENEEHEDGGNMSGIWAGFCWMIYFFLHHHLPQDFCKNLDFMIF